MRTLALGLGTLLVGTTLFAAEPEPMTLDQAQRNHVLLVVAKPIADYHLRREGSWGGRPTGVFDLTFDYETGHLREIQVVQSTGVTTFDIAVIAALKKWRAKPRTVHILRVPMTFLP